MRASLLEHDPGGRARLRRAHDDRVRDGSSKNRANCSEFLVVRCVPTTAGACRPPGLHYDGWSAAPAARRRRDAGAVLVRAMNVTESNERCSNVDPLTKTDAAR